MSAVTHPVTKNVEQNSTNDLVTTHISGVYASIAATQPSHGTTSVVDGTHLYYTPTSGYLGADSFTYTASWPPSGLSDPATVTINVVSSTSVPLLSDTYPAFNCNSSNNIVPLDFVNLVSKFNIIRAPNNGIATVIGQEIVYTPSINFQGADSFEYTASNVNGTSNIATVYITISPLLPIASASSQTVAFNSVNTPINLNVVGIYDSIHITSTSTHGSLHTGTNFINYTPNTQYQGLDSFNYFVTNVTGSSTVVTASLNVTIPVITALPATGELPNGIKDNVYSPITLSASGGLAPYTTAIISGSLPPGMNLSGDVISGTPTQVGLYGFTIAFTDSHSPSHFTVYNDYFFSVFATASSGKFQWFTPSGLLFTATSGVSTSTVLAASNFTATYSLIAGALPIGLELQSSGLIIGTPATVTNLEHYKFVVRASVPNAITDNTFSIDVNPAPYGVGSISTTTTDFPFELNLRTFTLAVASTDVPYTNIYIKPLLTAEKRAVYSSFISSSSIFAPEFLYRSDDSNFGMQTDLKMYLEYGIQELNSATDYVSALDTNFYDRTFYFGNVNTITALDSLGKPVYDMVYVEVVDLLENVNSQVTSTNVTYYPSSIQNMRKNLEAVADVNPSMAPLFAQTAKNAGLGQLNVVVLCYALAGKGNKIVTRIKNSGFEFSQFNFFVDRITIENTLASTGSSYILFPKTSI